MSMRHICLHYAKNPLDVVYVPVDMIATYETSETPGAGADLILRNGLTYALIETPHEIHKLVYPESP